MSYFKFKVPEWVEEFGQRLIVVGTVIATVVLVLAGCGAVIFGIVFPVAATLATGDSLWLINYLWTLPVLSTVVVLVGMFVEWCDDTFW